MSDSQPTNDTDSLLADAADQFTSAVQRGECPSISDYALRYPAIANAIRRIFPALQALHPGNDPDSLSHLDRLGDFVIEQEIGRGGMGVVYQAHQESLDRTVALKILPLARFADSRQLTRFKNEARAAATLQHPHIVPVYSVGVEKGIHFYAMQLIRGQSLAELLNGPKPTDVDYQHQVAAWGLQAAQALDHAHSHGIIHRDIKPGNLLLDQKQQLWIADFGLARSDTDATVTISGDLVGTLRYMSPEQALAKRFVLDHRTDIYSLGMTLYELLTWKPAFAGQDRLELLNQISMTEPLPIRKVQANVDRDLETIVHRCVQKDPAHRFATAQDLADELQRYLNGQPILSEPPNAWERLVRWTNRHQALASTIAVTIFLAFVLATISTAMIAAAYRSAQQQRHRAETNLRLARDFIDETYLHEVERLQDEPGMTDEQRSTLQRLVRFYEQLPQEDRQDWSLQVDSLKVNYALAEIYQTLGLHSQAIQTYQQAIQQAVQLQQQRPDALPPQWMHVRCLTGLGAVHRAREDSAAAVRCFTEAIQLAADLATLFGNEPDVLQLQGIGMHLADVQDDLAVRIETLEVTAASLVELTNRHSLDKELRRQLALTYDRMGMANMAIGQFHDAEARFQEAIRMLELIVQDGPASPGLRFDLALTKHHFALFRQQNRDINASHQLAEDAIVLLQELVQNFPSRIRYRHSLAELHHHLAMLERVLGNRDKSDSHFQEAVALWDKLHREVPDTPEFASGLAHGYRGLAVAAIESERFEQAETHFSQAMRLIRELHEHFPSNSDYHADLLVTATEADFRLPAEQRIDKLQNCLSELKQLSEQHPSRTDYFGLVCRFQSLLGNLFANIDQLDQAEASFQESLRAMDAFANRFPEVTREEDMATEYMKVGSLSLQLGKYQAALDTQETAVEYFRSLAESQPTNPFFTSKLSSSLKRLGIAHSRLGNLSAAAACYQESLTLAKRLAQAHPDEAEYQGKIVRRQWLQAMLLLEQQDFAAAADVFFELQQSVAIFADRFPDHSEPTLTALEVDAWMVNAIVQPPSPKWDQAASILLQRLQIVQQKQDSVSEILLLMRISDLYVETDDSDAANAYLDQAWQVIRSLGAAQANATPGNTMQANTTQSNAELRIRLAEMQWMLARRLAWIGRTAESAGLSNELLAAASDPKLLSATVNGLAAYPLANSAQLQQVEQILAHTLEKQPQLNAFGLMGATLARLNQPDKAISMFESALSKPEGRTAVHLYRAAMCAKLLERHDQADQWLAEADRKAIFHDPLRRLEIIRLQQQACQKREPVE